MVEIDDEAGMLGMSWEFPVAVGSRMSTVLDWKGERTETWMTLTKYHRLDMVTERVPRLGARFWCRSVRKCVLAPHAEYHIIA